MPPESDYFSLRYEVVPFASTLNIVIELICGFIYCIAMHYGIPSVIFPHAVVPENLWIFTIVFFARLIKVVLSFCVSFETENPTKLPVFCKIYL